MKSNHLTEGSILVHLKNIAVPASIGLLFNTLYNVVDTFYAGRLSSDALAGLSLSFPIFFLIIALSSGIGSGTTALSSIALGKDDKIEFHNLLRNALFLSLIVGVVVIFFTPFITTFLFEFSGVTGDPLELGIAYTNTILFGNLLFIFNFVLNGVLNAQGDTKTYRNFLIVGFFLNLILDPLFIFGWFGLPRLGVVGIAIATIVVQFIGTIYLSYKVFKSANFELEIFKKTYFSLVYIFGILKQGVPASISMATIAIGVYIINYFVMFYGGSDAVAGYGAALRIEQLALLPALGLNVATIALVGQNYGAQKFDRIREIRKKAILIGLAIMTIGIVVIFPFARYLMRVFSDDTNVVEYGVGYLRIEVLAFFTYVLININIATLQGIKKPTFAIYIGVFRQFLPISLFYLLGTVLSMGIFGVWWGIVIINWLAVMITMAYTTFTLNKAEKRYKT